MLARISFSNSLRKAKMRASSFVGLEAAAFSRASFSCCSFEIKSAFSYSKACTFASSWARRFSSASDFSFSRRALLAASLSN